MSNLEQLTLYLLVVHTDRFIDGNDLTQNITDYMPQLNKFRLNICSTMLLNDQVSLPSNEDIQHSLKHFSDVEIISCVNYYPEVKKGQCHIYSYPFTVPTYPNIANNFPGGLFTCVTEVSLFDEHPFEHEFFIQIAQSFPLMRELTVNNRKPQNNKQCGRSNNNNPKLLIIQYPHLKCLCLKETHDDYVEQFLLHTKTCLPCNFTLYTDYRSLKRVTDKFIRKATRMNCAKARYVCFNKIPHFPKRFKNYFLDVDTRVSFVD
jgi:hypothetical protein